MHTAVKIAPEYEGGVVHVLDASRSVTVAGSLLSKEQKSDFIQNINKEYEQLRVDFGNRRSIKELLSFSVAQQNPVIINWSDHHPVQPEFTGTLVFEDVEVGEIATYIDWQPFFIAWELHGKFPALLNDEVIGQQATQLYEDAKQMLKNIIDEKWLKPRAVLGFWEVNKSAPDTLQIKKGEKTIALEWLRQQSKKASGQPNFSLADFIHPEQSDYLGAFSVTIQGIEKHIEQFEAQHDDYNKIMLQALTDRLAEAFAEWLHQKVRRQYWGYAKEEDFSNEELIKEKYQGIRPAPGYPACPDHTEKYKLFELLGGEDSTGIHLTESLAMYPASSVCGWYFSHPQSQYFGLGKIGADQLQDYAQRKGMSIEEMERWLRPVME
jgi:5-methyltetrahydrofolate--homocysteine methyltransferase